MFADKRARAVGDLITVLVQETSTASKENSTKTSKSSSVDASLDTLLYSPTASAFLTKGGKLPAMKFGGSQSFDGGGKINNSEKISARIAVRVVDVLPNGNMIIEGRRETLVSGEKQEAVLRGMVRTEDIAANNTVLSYNVAEASIRFVSKGTIADNQRKGWLHKVWEKVTPF
jgi:flagellar L-ring protein precursor FlgH